MRIVHAADYEDMSRKAANLIAAQVVMDPAASSVLPPVPRPSAPIRTSSRPMRRAIWTFPRSSTYNLDEYRGLSHDDPQSYHYFMKENLFDHINIDQANTHVPDGSNPDAEATCAEYDHIVEEAGYPDLQLLGIGTMATLVSMSPTPASPGYGLRRPHREHHRGQQPPVRQHRGRSSSGVHHGHPHHHERLHGARNRQWREEGPGRARHGAWPHPAFSPASIRSCTQLRGHRRRRGPVALQVIFAALPSGLAARRGPFF